MTKFASHHFLLYAVYICQKSLNFIYAFKCYQQQETCAIANMAARCVLYNIGALKNPTIES